MFEQTINDPTSDPTCEYRLVTQQGFPHGLRCGRCDRAISEGQPFASVPNSLLDDGTMATLLVCCYCVGVVLDQIGADDG